MPASGDGGVVSELPEPEEADSVEATESEPLWAVDVPESTQAVTQAAKTIVPTTATAARPKTKAGDAVMHPTVVPNNCGENSERYKNRKL